LRGRGVIDRIGGRKETERVVSSRAQSREKGSIGKGARDGFPPTPVAVASAERH